MSPPLIIEMATTDMSVRLLLGNRIQFMREHGYNAGGLCAAAGRAGARKAGPFPLDTVSMARELSLFHDVYSLFLLWRYFRRTRPSIVFTHTPKAGLLGPVAARLAGVPCVVHVVHGYLIHDKLPWTRKILGWILEKHTALWSHLCLSQSREDIIKGEKYRIISRHRFKYLGNGINVEKYSPAGYSRENRDRLRKDLGIDSDETVVGFIGRLVEEKGTRELFEAIDKINKSGKHARFVIAGPVEKDQSDAISENRIEEMKRKYNAIFTGFVENTRDILSIFDLFVLPTYREGIPRALMEASAMKVPCIATDIRGCREVVLDGKTGWLVEPRDADALSAKIIEVLEMPREARERIGKAARQHIVRNFNEQRVFKRFKRICDVLLKKVGPHP